MSESARYGAIEAGGTKVICGWINDEDKILESCRIPTKSPEKGIPDMSQFFLSVSEPDKTHSDVVGIVPFGPDLYSVYTDCENIDFSILPQNLGQVAILKGALT